MIDVRSLGVGVSDDVVTLPSLHGQVQCSKEHWATGSLIDYWRANEYYDCVVH